MLELLAITPGIANAKEASALVDAWVAAGVQRVAFALLLRLPDQPPQMTFSALRPWVDAGRRHHLAMLLSMRPQHVREGTALALGEGLFGVQLRGDAPDPVIVQVRDAAPTLCIGRSRHGVAPPDETGADPADYCCLAPIFAPRSAASHGKVPIGLSAVQRWSAHGRWVVALGGVTPQTAPPCLAAGARGIAAISSFLGELANVVDNVAELVSITELHRHASRP